MALLSAKVSVTVIETALPSINKDSKSLAVTVAVTVSWLRRDGTKGNQ